MRRIALVRRRDGETVPFEQQRVRDAIHRALLAAGSEDTLLATEIAGVVELFLEKTFYDEIPDTEQIEDMVEKVLIETGHAAAAKAFILHRERRSRLREARSARDGPFEPTLFDNRVVVVDDAAAGRSAPFSRARLARTLAADGAVPREVADEVAAEVEARLRRASVARAPASLMRSLADAELLQRAPELDLRRRGAAVLPQEQLSAALYRKGRDRTGCAPFPAVAARELGGAALRCHALSELLPGPVARAHLDGEIDVAGLERPAALFRASFSPADIASGAAPGCGTRAPAEAVRTGRRLSAVVGRVARFLDAAVTDGVTIHGAIPAYAGFVAEVARDAVVEEAWHLLFEASADLGGRSPQLRIAPVPGGGPGNDFAAALLRWLARRDGLPARDSMPCPAVTVSASALEDPAAREVLRLAAEAVLRGSRVVFEIARDDGREETAVAPATAGRVTLNLPRAARKVGRGNVEGLLRECDRLVDLAATAHVARRELLGQVAAAAGGSLAPILRAVRGRPALVDLSTATWSVGITGLNEALALISGFELHEGDDDVARLARRIVNYLALRVREAGLSRDLEATLDAEEDPRSAVRLFAADRAAHPAQVLDAFPDRRGYTPGVAVRADAPVDLIRRIECEEAVHAGLSSATLRLPLSEEAAGGSEGLLALLGKVVHAGRASRVEIVTW